MDRIPKHDLLQDGDLAYKRSWLDPAELAAAVKATGRDGAFIVVSAVMLTSQMRLDEGGTDDYEEKQEQVFLKSGVPYEYALNLAAEFKAVNDASLDKDYRMPVTSMAGLLMIGREELDWPEVPMLPPPLPKPPARQQADPAAKPDWYEKEQAKDEERARRGWGPIPPALEHDAPVERPKYPGRRPHE